MREINIQPKSQRREASAAKLIAEKGNTYSVFGLMHNDHVWLEIFDDKSKSWVPSDPSIGLVGVKPWIAARMGFGSRPLVTNITKEMIVPFVVILRENGKVIEDRSEFYLIQAFNSYYDNKLASLPSWSEWVSLISKLSKLGASAFEGKLNLHQYVDLMENLLKIYEEVKTDFLSLDTKN